MNADDELVIAERHDERRPAGGLPMTGVQEADEARGRVSSASPMGTAAGKRGDGRRR